MTAHLFADCIKRDLGDTIEPMSDCKICIERGNTAVKEWLSTIGQQPDDDTAGQKHDDNKRRYTLLPWEAIAEVVDVLEYGAKKYDVDNWRKVLNGQTRYFDAAMRHLIAHRSGEKTDPETGLSHLAHAACNVLFMLALDP